MQKHKKIVQYLKTLEKIENAAIQKLQPELTQINGLIGNIEGKIVALTGRLQREKEFLKMQNRLNYTNFFERINNEIKVLSEEKDKFLKEYDVIHERMMDHVLKEKAYHAIKNKNIHMIKKDTDRKDDESIADIINMRHFFTEK